MPGKLTTLLARRRFLPLFVTQALAAWNDNFFKNALLLLATFKAAAGARDAATLVALAGGLFILPFFLFSATAGRLADRFDKSRLIVATKLFEIVIVTLAFLGFASHDLAVLFAALFLMGVHSTFFSPLKYGILPEHLRHDELLAGNALVDAGTFLAILLGTLAAGLVLPLAGGAIAAGAVAIAAAVAGLVASLFIPPAPAAAPGLRLGFNIFAATAEMLRYAAARRDLFLAILGISWFYLVGATFVAEFPAYVRQTLGADEHVVTLFTAVFAIGVGIGSLLANRLLKGEISARHVPFAALGLSVFIIDFSVASPAPGAHAAPLLTLAAWLTRAANWRLLADLLGMAVCGGIFIVPLYALLQERSEKAHRARARDRGEQCDQCAVHGGVGHRHRAADRRRGFDRRRVPARRHRQPGGRGRRRRAEALVQHHRLGDLVADAQHRVEAGHRFLDTMAISGPRNWRMRSCGAWARSMLVPSRNWKAARPASMRPPA